ncbi:hypothetical protein V2J09_000481, partial [Rumex salicifolius]
PNFQQLPSQDKETGKLTTSNREKTVFQLLLYSAMEWSAVLSVSKPTLFLPKFSKHKLGSITHHNLTPRKQRTTGRISRYQLHCHKMFVPGFGEASPEVKAASYLHNFFTYIAVKIVTAQLESYNPEAYAELMEFLDKHSLNDGDKFCASLMRESSRHKTLALRILEVRSAYCKRDFEWDNLQRVANKIKGQKNLERLATYSQTGSA